MADFYHGWGHFILVVWFIFGTPVFGAVGGIITAVLSRKGTLQAKRWTLVFPSVLFILAAVPIIWIISMGIVNSVTGSSEREVKSYLYEKYGKEFTVVDIEGRGGDNSILAYRVETDGLDPDLGEYAEVYADRKLSPNLSDSYFGYLIRDEQDEYLKEFVQKEYPDCKVISSPSNVGGYPNELGPGNTLDDLLKADPNFILEGQIFLKKEEGDDLERIKRVVEDMKPIGHDLELQFYVVNPEWYDKITRKTVEDFHDEYCWIRSPKYSGDSDLVVYLQYNAFTRGGHGEKDDSYVHYEKP